MNGHELTTSSPRQSKSQTDANQFVLTFENNRYASELFGQFDQNLKLLEQRLNIDARARGNSVSISGEVMATNQARRALDYLYDRLQKGGSIELSDVEGAIRMAIAADDQLSLPTMERKAKLTMSQISTRKKTIAARTPMNANTTSPSAMAVAGLLRPILARERPPVSSNAAASAGKAMARPARAVLNGVTSRKNAASPAYHQCMCGRVSPRIARRRASTARPTANVIPTMQAVA